MIQAPTKLRLLFSVALIIGGIGAIGQAWLLYHELADCYPYKMMDAVYKTIANIGLYLAPFIAIAGGLLFGLKRLWLTPIISVTLCPLIFACVFKMALIVNEWNGIANRDWSFDGKTRAMAEQDFFSYTIWLAVIGLIVGACSSSILALLSKLRKLA